MDAGLILNGRHVVKHTVNGHVRIVKWHTTNPGWNVDFTEGSRFEKWKRVRTVGEQNVPLC